MWSYNLKLKKKTKNYRTYGWHWNLGNTEWQAALGHLISDSFMCWMKCVGKPAATGKGTINYRICQLCPLRWLKTNWCQYRSLNLYWYFMDKQSHNHKQFQPMKVAKWVWISFHLSPFALLSYLPAKPVSLPLIIKCLCYPCSLSSCSALCGSIQTSSGLEFVENRWWNRWAPAQRQ